MGINRVTIAGAGVLGSQIAFQVAFKGYEVAVFDINDEAIEAGKNRLNVLKTRYQEDLGSTQKEVDDAYNRIKLFTTLSDSVKDADLVIECVPEIIEIKSQFYKELSEVADEKTIFTSNSSTMIPSQIVGFTDRPEKFLHLHFANEIWKNNIGEVMKHAGTDEVIFEEVINFASSIGMVPIPIYKEQPGYVLNSLSVPFLNAAQALVVNGVADTETIDKTWMVSSGSPFGPFGMLDIVGLITPYNLLKFKAAAGDEVSGKIAEWLKTEFIDKGKLGKQSGEGFYKYPNPKYEEPDFLS